MSMNANVAQWAPDQRRTGSLVAAGVALVLTLVGVGTWFFAKEKANALYWVLVAFVAIVLVFVAANLVLGISADRSRQKAVPGPHVGPAGPSSMEAAPHAVRTLSLRCGDCGTVFDVTDTGDRPLYHTCPGCGAEGVLRAPAEPAPQAAPAPAAEAEPDAERSPWAPPPPRKEGSAWESPAPATAPAPPTAAAPAVAAPAAAQGPRRLKLRCGGCKEVFVIDDTGERPLRRPCPHCSRMGEIR